GPLPARGIEAGALEPECFQGGATEANLGGRAPELEQRPTDPGGAVRKPGLPSRAADRVPRPATVFAQGLLQEEIAVTHGHLEQCVAARAAVEVKQRGNRARAAGDDVERGGIGLGLA